MIATTDRERRWQALAALRDDAIRLVRIRTAQPEDAEEHVQEAMLRLVQIEVLDLDPPRLRALLVRAACCLSIDRHRRTVRQRRLLPRLFLGATSTPEDVVADRSEARWLAAGLDDLGHMEREALLHCAAGRRPGEIADLLGVDYKAAENALGRARRKLRLRAAGVAVALAALLRRLRPHRVGAVATTTAAGALVALHFGGVRLPALAAQTMAGQVRLQPAHIELAAAHQEAAATQTSASPQPHTAANAAAHRPAPQAAAGGRSLLPAMRPLPPPPDALPPEAGPGDRQPSPPPGPSVQFALSMPAPAFLAGLPTCITDPSKLQGGLDNCGVHVRLPSKPAS
jgi:RNA polymerase sigma factor (sigma-70 family)